MSYKVVFMRKSAAARATALVDSRDRFSMRAWVLSTFFFVIMAVLASSAVAQGFRFNSINIQGNNRIEHGTILAQAGLSVNQSLSAAELNDAYQALIASGFFESVEISPSGSRLTIVVVERPTINRITFEGN